MFSQYTNLSQYKNMFLITCVATNIIMCEIPISVCSVLSHMFIIALISLWSLYSLKSQSLIDSFGKLKISWISLKFEPFGILCMCNFSLVTESPSEVAWPVTTLVGSFLIQIQTYKWFSIKYKNVFFRQIQIDKPTNVRCYIESNKKIKQILHFFIYCYILYQNVKFRTYINTTFSSNEPPLR